MIIYCLCLSFSLSHAARRRYGHQRQKRVRRNTNKYQSIRPYKKPARWEEVGREKGEGASFICSANMSTIEELRLAIEEENRQHQQTMEMILRQRETLQGVLEEQRQSFQELIARVTKLRVLKAELLSMSSDAAVQELKFDTGSKGVDELLYTIQDNLEGTALTGDTLLNKFYKAAQQILKTCTSSKKSVFSSGSSGMRSSDIAFVTRNEIRGTQLWAQKHCKKCFTCDGKRLNLQPGEQVDEKSVGLARLPDLSRIPGKDFYKSSIRFLRKMSGERTLEVFRFSAVVAMRGKNGIRLTDSFATAKRVTDVITALVKKALATAEEEAKKAPWNEEATKNLLLSGAVEVFLHSLDANISVTVASSNETHVMEANCTPMNFTVAILAPTYIPTVATLLELLSDAEQRAYFAKYIVQPLAERIGKFLDMIDVVTFYTRVAINTVDALFRMTKAQWFADILGKGFPKSEKSVPQEKMAKKVHAVLLALSIFGTSVEVNCALPPPGDITDTASIKNFLLNIAESFLRLLIAPSPYRIPPMNDPKSANLIVSLLRAPTVFLEILNSTFSSNRRLPSTARVGVVDYLASPKAKIRHGLRLFSEIIVDVYRPYAPNTGVVIADDNGKSGKPKATGCTPISDMPRDIVRANVEVADWAESLMKRLLSFRKNSTLETELTQGGKELIRRVMEVGDGTVFSAFLKDVEALEVEMVKMLDVCVDVWLPFGSGAVDMVDCPSELLYVRLERSRHN
ncbi:hypothetical protein ECC02_001176 [Trypanosoma cruzi]|nr:hypothetical protein ECC02_001176 [Trypanosoma cruzi]